MVTLYDPESASMSTTRLNRINPVMLMYIDKGELPGLVTFIARHGKPVHFGCFGMRDAEAQKPMQQNTIFQIASMTKLVTCVAALMLYEKGYFQLNDPVSRFIPEIKDVKVFSKTAGSGVEFVPLDREPTIRDLFTHTSGLSSAPPEEPTIQELYKSAGLRTPKTLQEYVEKVLSVPLFHQPGRAWRYGPSYDVLARIVEVITGNTFDEYLRQNILAPLNMIDTDYHVPEEKKDRLAAWYEPEEAGGYKRIGPAVTDYTLPKVPGGSGGLFSTISDYYNFAQMMLNGGELEGVRLLGRKTVELMVTNHLSSDLLPFEDPIRLSKGYYTKGYGFGLGVRVLMNPAENEITGSVGNYGWAGAFNTYVWIDPREKLIGFVWAQCTRLYYYPIDRQFTVLTYQAITD